MSLAFMPQSIGGRSRAFDFGPDLKLDEEYRPRTFEDVAGHASIVDRLRDMVAIPQPRALIFSGPTGVGKSSMAQALANELGAHPVTGVWTLASGETDGAKLDAIERDFRFVPMGGGWRVVIIEEADWMTKAPKVFLRWNSILDCIPAKTMIVFTTNDVDAFTDRFRDRCVEFHFTGDYGTLAQDAQLLINRIWSDKVGRGAPPRVADLGVERKGLISFRRVVSYLEPYIVDALKKGPSKPVLLSAPTLVRCKGCKRHVSPKSLCDSKPGHCLHCALGKASA